MRVKPARTPVNAGKAPRGVKRGKLKRDILEDLRAAIAGKDKYAEVLKLSDADVLSNVPGIISTRSIAVDVATNIGGLPRGRLVEIYGMFGTGKTTLWQAVMAECQAQGGEGALHDSEEKVDKNYARRMGVDIDRCLAIQPDLKTVEAIVETTDRMLDFWLPHHQVPLVAVWDSVAGSATENEVDAPKDFGQHTTMRRNSKGETELRSFTPGDAARAWRRAMRQLIGKIARSSALVIAINQQYVQIGAYSRTPGVKLTTYGGGGIPFHATIRIELVRTGMLKDLHDNPIGIEGICKIFKNNLAPSRNEKFALQWGVGFVNAWSIFQKLKGRGYITQAGGVYTFSQTGLPPAQWQGGWQGLQDLLVKFPDLYGAMALLYRQLPPDAAEG